jgi:hypothetical protein
MQITARNITVEDLFTQLREQQARKVDIVVAATDLVAEGGKIRLIGQEPIMGPSGVTDPNGLYVPLDTFLIHLADKYNIRLEYLRRMAEQRPDIFDANINGWIHGEPMGPDYLSDESYPADERNFMFRGFLDPDGDWLARGLMGDRYRRVDNLDVVVATLRGLEAAGVDSVGSADIGDKHMYLRIVAPALRIPAEELLKGYRSPFDDEGERRAGDPAELPGGVARAAETAAQRGGDPILNPGIVVSNSELGFSSTSVTPRCEFLVCTNGQTVTSDIVRAVHRGGRLEVGFQDWSEETRKLELATMTSKIKDSVEAFISEDYWTKQVEKWTALAGKRVGKPEEAVGHVAQALGFSQEEQDTVLRHFLSAGQRTAGGIMHAITSTAQTLANPDRAAEFEGIAVQALELV